MNDEVKNFLDEQGEIIANLSDSEIHELLAGSPPLEAGDFISIILRNNHRTSIYNVDEDNLIHRLKSRIAKSSKFDKKIIKKYMDEHGISKSQAKALVVLKAQYLCNEFAAIGVEVFIEMFKARFDEAFDKFEDDMVRVALERWRVSSFFIQADDIPFEKHPSFWQAKKSFIQNQTGGRPTGVKAKKKKVDPAKKDANDAFFIKLIKVASQRAIEKNADSALNYKMIADEIAEVKRVDVAESNSRNLGRKEYRVKPVAKTETIIKDTVTKQIVRQWFQKLGILLDDIDHECRENIRR